MEGQFFLILIIEALKVGQLEMWAVALEVAIYALTRDCAACSRRGAS